MSVHCAYCGEELMGAVNRCWRCGRRFAHAPTPESEPPVRRSPIAGPLDRPDSIDAYAPSDGRRFQSSNTATLAPNDPNQAAVAAMIMDGAGMPAATAGSAAEPPASTPATTIAPSIAVSSTAEPAGRLRVVERSDASHLGSPFDRDFEPDWQTRWVVRVRGPFVRAIGWAKKIGAKRAVRSQTATGAPQLSPLRSAFANASFLMSMLLAIIAWCVSGYALIALIMAAMGIGMAGVSLFAAPRWRVALPTLACFALLFHITYVEYNAWSRQQAIQQGLLPLDSGETE